VILDRLEAAALYGGLAPGLDAAFAYLRRFDPTTPPGRHEVEGERVFAIVSRYETAPATTKRFEAHRAHLDVQYVASGAERILYAPRTGLSVSSPYAAEDDVEFLDDPPASTSLLLAEGAFAVFGPDDAHKPGCMAGRRHEVLKVVVKVRIG
jgi:biofilm protein TabA